MSLAKDLRRLDPLIAEIPRVALDTLLSHLVVAAPAALAVVRAFAPTIETLDPELRKKAIRRLKDAGTSFAWLIVKSSWGDSLSDRVARELADGMRDAPNLRAAIAEAKARLSVALPPTAEKDG